jgi:hypothetical protein
LAFAGGGGGVLPAGGAGGVLPAGGAGGFLPAGAGGGGVLPAVGLAGGALPAGEGALVPAAGVPAGLAPVGALAACLASPALGALPPLASGCTWAGVGAEVGGAALTFLGLPKSSSVVSGRISVTTPAAMVFPPSLRANLDPFSMVRGKLSFALMVRLSPGLAILTPSARQISAAVSAVL